MLRNSHKRPWARALYIGLALAVVLAALAHPAYAHMEFNAATYNLRLNTPDDGPNAWPLRRRRSRACVDRLSPGRFAGHAGRLMDQVEDLAAMPGFAYVGVGRDDGKRAGEHSAIFYRTSSFPVAGARRFLVERDAGTVPGKGWDATCCNRIASWAKLRERVSGQVFYAFSVHFDHQGVIARRESAHLMVRKMHEIAGDNPVLCLGDFNATPESEPIRIMSASLRDARAVSQAPPYGPVGTFNDFKIDAPLKDRIDYIFLGPRWQVLRYAVLTDMHEARFPSDHLPVVARLKLD
jgi:endonuclease/exonuclease/phosphatase family metal-dependent hydrolase